MNFKILNLLILYSLLILNSFLFAQNSSLTGRVIDKNSRMPIKDVNIYLVNTFIGTTTNEKGYFELSKLPQGTFTVVISHISYYFIKKTIKLARKSYDIGVIKFSLKAHELETVLVTEDDDDDWNDQFELFREKFIGEGANSDSTHILNPYKIDFWEDDDKMIASSTEPIEILNNSLGYRIRYFLDYFEVTDNYTKYSGNTVFVPLFSKSEPDSVRWDKNRRETYEGSFRHFLETLGCGDTRFIENYGLNELNNNSLIDSINLNKNMDRPNQRSSKITYRYKIDSLTSIRDSQLNSTGFFIYYVQRLPWEVVKPFTEVPISTKNLLSEGNIETEKFLKFNDYLRVYFIPDYSDNLSFINYEVKDIINVQGSYLKLEQESVLIDIHGRYYDKFGIHTFGKFGQERISDMLPYEYVYKKE